MFIHISVKNKCFIKSVAGCMVYLEEIKDWTAWRWLLLLSMFMPLYMTYNINVMVIWTKTTIQGALPCTLYREILYFFSLVHRLPLHMRHTAIEMWLELSGHMDYSWLTPSVTWCIAIRRWVLFFVTFVHIYLGKMCPLIGEESYNKVIFLYLYRILL